MPRRFQLRRTRGWQLPSNTVNIARPGRYGNPHTMREDSPEKRHRVVTAYREDPLVGRLPYTEDDLKHEPGGVNVACHCSEDEECHGDVVLEVANSIWVGPKHTSRQK